MTRRIVTFVLCVMSVMTGFPGVSERLSVEGVRGTQQARRVVSPRIGDTSQPTPQLLAMDEPRDGTS